MSGATEQALISTNAAAIPRSGSPAATSQWHAFLDVPVRLSVDIPLPSMSLRALGALQPGQVLSSAVSTSDDLTVVIGGAPISLARFEFMDGRMAMRMTRLLGAARTGA